MISIKYCDHCAMTFWPFIKYHTLTQMVGLVSWNKTFAHAWPCITHTLLSQIPNLTIFPVNQPYQSLSVLAPDSLILETLRGYPHTYSQERQLIKEVLLYRKRVSKLSKCSQGHFITLAPHASHEPTSPYIAICGSTPSMDDQKQLDPRVIV